MAVSKREVQNLVGKRCLVHYDGGDDDMFAVFEVMRIDAEDAEDGEYVKVWGSADEWSSDGRLSHAGYLALHDLRNIVECPSTDEDRDAIILIWRL